MWMPKDLLSIPSLCLPLVWVSFLRKWTLGWRFACKKLIVIGVPSQTTPTCGSANKAVSDKGRSWTTMCSYQRPEPIPGWTLELRLVVLYTFLPTSHWMQAATKNKTLGEVGSFSWGQFSERDLPEMSAIDSLSSWAMSASFLEGRVSAAHYSPHLHHVLHRSSGSSSFRTLASFLRESYKMKVKEYITLKMIVKNFPKPKKI